MDFLKIIRSIEELLYEAMTWILFYPRTLWRCLRHPDWITGYTDKELGETPGEQFTDMISPPLFLIISIIIAHGVGMALGMRLHAGNGQALQAITGNVENLLAFRALFFSIFPLAMAAGLLHTRGQPIDRNTLRSPFYLQCYLAAPFAIMISSAVAFLTVAGTTHHLIGAGLLTFGLVWFVTVQTRWFFHQIEPGWWTAFGLALRYLGLALLLVLMILVVLIVV
jgi:hypothetical protein